jgi:hypothetical protein
MPVQKSQYESCLASLCNHLESIALLKLHRPYLEMLPSLRRPEESVITIPLPIVRFRGGVNTTQGTTSLPCDMAILMCDPEWKIKTDTEVLVFIHRPDEDFSDLLKRWRQSQVWLDKDYEWLMPPRYNHILCEGTTALHPLFVVFPETPERIQRGLLGADLPFIVQTPESFVEEEKLNDQNEATL